MTYGFVARAAIGAGDVANLIPGRSAAGWGDTTAACNGSGNLTAAPALERCRGAWSRQLASVADGLTDLGREMRAGIVTYDAMDRGVGSSYQFGITP